MNTQPTLREIIAACPRVAHSEWMTQNPATTLQERYAMFESFERTGQIVLDDWNSVPTTDHVLFFVFRIY